LEQAAVRECKEESGIHLDTSDVQFAGSEIGCYPFSGVVFPILLNVFYSLVGFPAEYFFSSAEGSIERHALDSFLQKEFAFNYTWKEFLLSQKFWK